jgi:hypothetical protein
LRIDQKVNLFQIPEDHDEKLRVVENLLCRRTLFRAVAVITRAVERITYSFKDILYLTEDRYIALARD